MYLVEDLYQQYGKSLGLELLGGHNGLQRRIHIPEVHRPGLALTGYLKGHAKKRLLVFGKVEIEYLRELPPDERKRRLSALLTSVTPAVLVSKRYRLPKELIALSEDLQFPLFQTNMSTMSLINRLTLVLAEEFSTSMSVHGTLVEVFGIGLLIQGDSCVGKSEAALGLIEQGHRLISDDIVKVRNKGGQYLEGSGAELTRHHMEIRGIGIINIPKLYGAVCVRDTKSIDIVVRLETWDDEHFYDRVGVDEKNCDLLGVLLPFHVLPVKPGRDVVRLLETIALIHRLKEMGYHSANEFRSKLHQAIGEKSGRRLPKHAYSEMLKE